MVWAAVGSSLSWAPRPWVRPKRHKRRNSGPGSSEAHSTSQFTGLFGSHPQSSGSRSPTLWALASAFRSAFCWVTEVCPTSGRTTHHPPRKRSHIRSRPDKGHHGIMLHGFNTPRLRLSLHLSQCHCLPRSWSWPAWVALCVPGACTLTCCMTQTVVLKGHGLFRTAAAANGTAIATRFPGWGDISVFGMLHCRWMKHAEAKTASFQVC